MSQAEACDAVDVIEPQMVIESLLSYGWGSQSRRRWWGRASVEAPEPSLVVCIRDDSVGPLKSDYELLHPRLENLEKHWYLGFNPA